jgi:hypothetical protein
MIHVCTVLGFLVLVLSSLGTESSSLSLVTKSLEITKTENQSTVTRPTAGKNRVTIGPLRQEAFMDKSVQDSWGYLNELGEYKNIFSIEERNAADDLIHLGIRIIVKRQSEGALRIRYRGTVMEAPKLVEEGDNFDEFYVCKNVMGTLEGAIDSVWSVLRLDSLEDCSNKLKGFISQNKLLSSALILKLRPEAAEHLPIEFYREYIFVINNNTQNVLKYFIFQNNPKSFIEKFLQVYKKDVCTNILDGLSRILIDLKVSNEKVQEAFDFAVKFEDCPIPVLAAFVNSRRPLMIESCDLERVILNGKEGAKDRVVLLKLSKDSNFLEKIVSKCFTSGLYSPLIREILFDRKLANLLSTEFTRTLFLSFVYYDRVNAIKFILSTELMKKLKTKIKKFGSILAKSIDHVSLESFKALVRANFIGTRAPIFTSQDIIKAAFLLIKKKVKPEFLEFLIRERFIAPNQKVTFDTGETFSLLAVAVKERNHGFVKLLNKINWSRCEDVFEIEAGVIDDEMKSLLICKGAKFPSTIDFNDNESIKMRTESSPSPSPPPSSYINPVSSFLTPLKMYSGANDLLTNETTFETPEVKRRKISNYPEVIHEYFKNALESQDEDCMGKILYRNEDFKRSYGYNRIIGDLYNAQMIKSLNQILDHIPVDLITKIVQEFSEQECEYVIFYLISNRIFKLESEWFEGKNLIAHLLKIRRASFALNLIERFKFDLKSSKEDPWNNPEGDIILNAVWNMDLVDRLLELGASPNVKVIYPKFNITITLKEYAKLTDRHRLLQILEKYNAK